MNSHDGTHSRIEVLLLDALANPTGCTRDECVRRARSLAERDPKISESAGRKIDIYLVTQFIRDAERENPPLVFQLDYEPNEVSPTGNVLGSARFALTTDGLDLLHQLNRRPK